MTCARLGQQLTLDFTTTASPASGTQVPLAASSLFGRIPQPGLPLWNAPVLRPAKADVPEQMTVEPLAAEPPKPEPARPELLQQISPASARITESEPPRNHHNYRITDADCLGSGSPKAKCQDNLIALELLKRIEANDRRPTPEEKRALVRYVGWGGLPQVFDSGNDKWSAERQRLEQLLTPEELESARATTLNAHYTAPGVVSAMYDALRRLGFSQGRVLEPALGLTKVNGVLPALAGL